jgi:hypothetical protein
MRWFKVSLVMGSIEVRFLGTAEVFRGTSATDRPLRVTSDGSAMGPDCNS